MEKNITRKAFREYLHRLSIATRDEHAIIEPIDPRRLSHYDLATLDHWVLERVFDHHDERFTEMLEAVSQVIREITADGRLDEP